jgi:alkylation response protein AidB-like acyl-CoA dehydrogenase
MNFHSTTSEDDYLARVARVTPAIRDAADEIEREQLLPIDLRNKLHDEKLFRLLLPKPYGGEELEPALFFETISAIAEIDSSTAWCVCQANGVAMTAAFVEPEVAQNIWGRDPHAVMAWGPGKADFVEKEDGFVLSGRWQFASGSRHATWLGGRTPMTLPDGKTVFRVFLFPAKEAEMIEIWDVLGLRGTGSGGYSVKDLFVSKDYTATPGLDVEERIYDAPLYWMPSDVHQAIGFTGVAIGIARGMLDQFKEIATEKKPYRMTNRLCDNALIQSDAAISEARLRSARAYMLNEATECWEDVLSKGKLTEESNMRLRLASTHCIHEAKSVADIVYDAAGATAIFKGHLLERHFRDIHTLTQQYQGRKTHFQAVGASLLGLDPNVAPPT